MVTPSSMPPVELGWQHRISVERYHRMIDAGIFDEDERVELLEGFIVAMSRQDPDHAWAVATLTDRLARVLPPDLRLRGQLPLTLPASEPEPDLAVVDTEEERTAPRHPRTARLVIEVARESLRRDRAVKSLTCAAAGISEYWIVNLIDRCVEVHRDPAPAGYVGTSRAVAGEVVASTAVPGITVRIADLLRG